MTNSWKTIAVFLLCNLAVAAWAADLESARRDVPTGVNDNGVLLDVRGVFEAKELAGQLIVLYQDPTDGSCGYTVLEGPTTGEDVLDLGDIELAVTFDDVGGLKTVEMWENETWSTVPQIQAKAIKEGQRYLPTFEQVPEAPNPCEEKGGTYMRSEWDRGCLWDWFSGCTRETATIACCDGGVGPRPFDDPQRDCYATATN